MTGFDPLTLGDIDVPKLLFAVSLLAALILAACGSATPSPSQGAVSPPPASPAPSAPTEPSTPEPAPATPEPPAVTPEPTARPIPKPTPRPSFTHAEGYLVEGIMRGISDCSPVRAGDLPRAAIAGIDCELVDSPAARMGFYLFKTDADMLDAYMARMDAEGIVIDSGGCAPGEGESAYVPYAENETAPDRHACFVNSDGYGNYRATISGAHVYIGLLGRTVNMAKLADWAWLGNEDTPGSPTLWQQSSVYRP